MRGAGRSASEVRRLVGLVPPLMRLEARRPAAWVAAACGVACAGIAEPLLAFAAGGLAATAAIGERPAWSPPAARHVACGLRWAIPVVACLAAGVWCHGAVGWALAAMLLAGVTTLVVAGPTTSAADASSAALSIIAAAIAAGRVAAAAATPTAPVVAGAWAVGTAVLAWWEQRGGRSSAALSRASGVAIGRGPLPAGGPARQLLAAAAMGSTLAAMAAWLLLSPEHAAAFVELALGWFVCLAFPAALLQDGAAVNAAWEGTMRGAASSRRGPLLLPLGRMRFAASVAAGHAAVLGWPALVAAVVGLATPAGVWPALVAVGGIVLAALALAALSRACFGLGISGDTAHAVAAAVVIGCLAVAPACKLPHAGEKSAAPPPPLFHLAPESRC